MSCIHCEYDIEPDIEEGDGHYPYPQTTWHHIEEPKWDHPAVPDFDVPRNLAPRIN